MYTSPGFNSLLHSGRTRTDVEIHDRDNCYLTYDEEIECGDDNEDDDDNDADTRGFVVDGIPRECANMIEA